MNSQIIIPNHPQNIFGTRRKLIGLTCRLIELLGRQNDLDTLSIVRVWNRMVHQANGADDLADWLYVLALTVGVNGVARVADDQWSLGGLISTSNAGDLTVLHQYLVYLGIQHVSSAVNGAESRESLWEAT